MRKPIFAILAACAAIVAALAIPAVAPAATFRTSVSINFVDRAGPDIFRGRVGSPNAACISDRTVRLYRVRPARDQLIDTDKSENNGSWSIDVEGDPAPGDYYVRIPRSALGANACSAAMSATIPVAG